MNEIQFEKGDRVFHVAHRWCEVIARASDGLIKVWLSRNGTTEIEYFDPRELFFEEIVIPESARTRPKPKHDLKIDDRVLVRDTGDEDWSKRHFAGWTDHGRMTTFLEGSSWTACGDTVAWDEWKLPDADSEKSEVKNDE